MMRAAPAREIDIFSASTVAVVVPEVSVGTGVVWNLVAAEDRGVATVSRRAAPSMSASDASCGTVGAPPPRALDSGVRTLVKVVTVVAILELAAAGDVSDVRGELMAL
jgi:hypothetical protein